MRSMSDDRILLALAISILLHLLVGFSIYMLKNNVDLQEKQGQEKVKLAFKRGGDSKRDDSTLKENTSIPSSLMGGASGSGMSGGSMGGIIRNNMPKNKANNATSKSTKTMQDRASEQNKAQNSIDLSSLQIYNNLNLNPNLKQNNYQQNLSYITSSKIPSDQKQEIIELYGDELGDYGMEEIDFLVNNLREIGRITQYHINRRGYPQEAVLLRQSGKNIIEFYLYPNGDISDLKVVSSSKSIILDNDMQTNIKVAFKDYPRPSVRVKIRFYMSYNLLYN